MRANHDYIRKYESNYSKLNRTCYDTINKNTETTCLSKQERRTQNESGRVTVFHGNCFHGTKKTKAIYLVSSEERLKISE